MWREVLRDPTAAAHTIGKLCKRVGKRRVLWGTDAVWYGSPQSQIEAFRAFSISDEFQDRFGYPALTTALKARIFGLNAADLFGVDAEATRCGLVRDPLANAQTMAAHLHAERRAPRGLAPERPDHTARDVRLDPPPRHILDARVAGMSPTEIWGTPQ